MLEGYADSDFFEFGSNFFCKFWIRIRSGSGAN